MSETDFVILELEVVVGMKHSHQTGFVNFILIDTAPNYPKVQKILNHILEEEDDAVIISHHITSNEITEKTDISHLEHTKH